MLPRTGTVSSHISACTLTLSHCVNTAHRQDANPQKLPKFSGYAAMYRDVRAAVDLCHRDGSLKRHVAADPGKYIHDVSVDGWGSVDVAVMRDGVCFSIALCVCGCRRAVCFHVLSCTN